WGIGELWLDGDVVDWHSLPTPATGLQGSCNPVADLVERLQAYFAGEAVTFEDVAVDLEYETPFLERCAHALRAVPRGETVTYGAGGVHLGGLGEVALHLDLASSNVARRGFALLRAFDVDSEIRTYQQHAFDRATRFQLHVDGTAHAYEVLHRAGVLHSSHR